MLKWGVAALLIAALGLGSWQLADTLLDRVQGESGSPNNSQSTKTDEDEKKPKESKPLTLAGASVFGKDPIKAEDAGKAVDGNPDTAWVTKIFYGYDGKFGNLDSYDDGSGIVVDLGGVHEVTGIDVEMRAAGHKVEVRAAAPEESSPRGISDFPQELVKLGSAGKKLENTRDTPVKTRFVLVHITALPSEGGGDGYRGGINEIKILGIGDQPAS